VKASLKVLPIVRYCPP